ncbi:hypothetical protein JZ751_019057 [Albula glossodonta]|uniref:Uncharacterized protein n=1 Tax=Albula glossodonta TaxID=121402 RepID=A0A8T2NR24_9TELE|nr:hypothetical protein JZ751_019057 [Albula glossodonta]
MPCAVSIDSVCFICQLRKLVLNHFPSPGSKNRAQSSPRQHLCGLGKPKNKYAQGPIRLVKLKPLGLLATGEEGVSSGPGGDQADRLGILSVASES